MWRGAALPAQLLCWYSPVSRSYSPAAARAGSRLAAPGRFIGAVAINTLNINLHTWHLLLRPKHRDSEGPYQGQVSSPAVITVWMLGQWREMWGAGNENQGPRIEERSSRMCVCVCKQETLVVLPPLTLRWRITVLYFSNYVNSTRLKMRSILSLTILITNLRGENWEDDDEIKWK